MVLRSRAAEISEYSVSTLRNRERAGKLTPYRDSRGWIRYPLGQVLELKRKRAAMRQVESARTPREALERLKEILESRIDLQKFDAQLSLALDRVLTLLENER